LSPNTAVARLFEHLGRSCAEALIFRIIARQTQSVPMKTYKVIRAVSHSRLEIDINNYAGRGWIALSISISNEGGGEMFYALLERNDDGQGQSSDA
jgi:hypothetical protein